MSVQILPPLLRKARKRGPFLRLRRCIRSSEAPVAALSEGTLKIGFGEGDARLSEPCVRAGAAPRPLEWGVGEPHSDWAAREVARGRRELLIALDLARVGMRAEEMGAAPVPAVVRPRGAGGGGAGGARGGARR